MNQDLIFVTAYCPTEEQIERLRLCCQSLLIDGFDLAVISHTPIPEDIQKMCKWSIYDSENELVWEEEFRHWEVFRAPKWEIMTKYFKKVPFYGLAIYRMFSQIAKLAESFGYKRIYHVEYDYIILDQKIFTNHKKLLSTIADSVFYIKKNDGNMILGGLKSFKVKTLPELFKNYDRQKMLQRIKKESLLPLEEFTSKIFRESGIPVLIDSKLLESKISTKNFESQNLNWTLCYNPQNDNLGLCYVNLFGETEIKVVVNEKKLFTLEMDPINSIYKDLANINEVDSIKIIKGETIIYQSDINLEFKSKLKLYSIVTTK